MDNKDKSNRKNLSSEEESKTNTPNNKFISEHEKYLAQMRKKRGLNDPSRYKFDGRFGEATLAGIHKSFTPNEIQIIQKWIAKPEKMLIIQGPAGTGKSHLSAAIYNDFWERGKDIRYIIHGDIFAQMHYDIKEGENQDNMVTKLSDCDILIIDDVGSTKPTEWNISQFFKIINNRYNNLNPTLITTNLNDKQYEEFLGFRVASRLTADENITIAKWGQEDLRKHGM